MYYIQQGVDKPVKFTRKTDYALRAMQNLARRYYLARSEGVATARPVPVASIAKDTGMSIRFLQGTVARLSRAGLLKTAPGPRGGIALSRSPEAISILEIVESVEGGINLMGCFEHPENCCDANLCSIMSVLHAAQAALAASLRNTNLKLMVKAKNDPFHALPEKHFLKPQFGCPVLK
jgi:Rrf2 family protein